MMQVDEARTLGVVRRILVFVLAVGMLGTATELLFLKHDEEALQLIPLVLIGAAFAVLLWHAVRPGPASIRSIQIVMALFMAAGAMGVYFHYGANVEFQHEVDPSLAGSALFWK